MNNSEQADAPTSASAQSQELSNAFVCYSPVDVEFIKKLDEAFKKSKRKIWLNQAGTSLDNDNRKETLLRIEAADYFIFVISADSINSETCLEELTHAVQLRKHLIPILYRRVGVNDLPAPLKNLEPINFQDGNDFKQSFELLLRKFDPVLRFDAFISYSRKDQTFVRLLNEALVREGRKVWIDRKDLRPTEPWMKAIKSGIEAADNFVFVITPHSLTSTVCEAEVAHAIENHKRLVPVVRENVDVETVPPQLSEPNWIYFRENDDFDVSLDLLIKAFDTDLDYVREHSRLQLRALEWERSGVEPAKADKSLLLRGRELQNARQWLMEGERGKQPDPTSLHKIYISSSRKAVVTRRAITATIAVAALALTVVLIQVIRQQTGEVSKQSRIVSAQELANQSNRIRAQQSNLLPASTLFAVAAMRQYASIDTDQALRQSLSLLPLRVASISHEQKVNDVAFSPNGEYLATACEDGLVQLWNATSGQRLWGQKQEGAADYISFSKAGKYLAAANADTLTVWEVNSQTVILKFKHDGNVMSISFSPGEKYVATGAYDRTVRVWSLADGRLLWSKQIQKPFVASIFSPDEKYLATASFDSSVLILDAGTGRQTASLKHEVGMPLVAFSADGKQVVTASLGVAQVWETATGRKNFEVKHGPYISALASSPDGNSFATGGQDGIVHLWSLLDGKNLANIIHGAEIKKLSFSPDSLLVAAAGADYTARVFTAADGREVARMCHTREINALAFSPGGELLATASSDNIARVWESVSSFQRLATYKLPVDDVTISADGKYVASRSADRSTRIQTTDNGKVYWSEEFRGEIKDIKFSPDGEYFAIATRTAGPKGDSSDERSTVKILRIADRQTVQSLEFASVIQNVAFSGDSKSVATVGHDGAISMREIATGLEVWQGNAKPAVTAMAVSPDGKFLATVGDVVSVRRAVDGGVVHESEPGDQIVVMSFSSDGSKLALGGGDGNVFLLDIASGQLRKISTYESWVVGVGFSLDGRYLASAVFDGSSTLTDVGSGKQIALKFPDAIMTMALSPDAKYITAGGDAMARVWEFANGQEVARIVHGAEVKSVAFSRDGKYLATGSADNTSRLSLLRAQDMIAEACARLTTHILPSEWEEYTKEQPNFETCAKPPE
jgi:WD40 repeat protein